jgi:polyphosphate glucokinase
MVSTVKKLARDWKYDAVSIGYPGSVLHGRPIAEPYNLGRGWVGFDFTAAFGRPVKVVNDAAMQALGSYTGGKMLFLGLGTGLGFDHDRQRNRGADGARPPALQKEHL